MYIYIIMYIYMYLYIYILLYIYYNFTGSLAGTYLGTFLHRTLLCKLPFGRVSLTLSRGFFRIAKLFYETYFVDTKIKYFKRKLSSEEVLPLGPASTLEILVSGDDFALATSLKMILVPKNLLFKVTQNAHINMEYF